MTPNCKHNVSPCQLCDPTPSLDEFLKGSFGSPAYYTNCPGCREFVEATPSKTFAGYYELECSRTGAMYSVSEASLLTIDPKEFYDNSPTCDCGALKAKTTHALWCTSRSSE